MRDIDDAPREPLISKNAGESKGSTGMYDQKRYLHSRKNGDYLPFLAQYYDGIEIMESEERILNHSSGHRMLHRFFVEVYVNLRTISNLQAMDGQHRTDNICSRYAVDQQLDLPANEHLGKDPNMNVITLSSVFEDPPALPLLR